MIEMGKLLFVAMVEGICSLVCGLFDRFRKSRRAKIGAVIFANLVLTPCTAPALAALTVIGSAVVVMALPVVRILEA